MKHCKYSDYEGIKHVLACAGFPPCTEKTLSLSKVQFDIGWVMAFSGSHGPAIVGSSSWPCSVFLLSFYWMPSWICSYIFHGFLRKDLPNFFKRWKHSCAFLSTPWGQEMSGRKCFAWSLLCARRRTWDGERADSELSVSPTGWLASPLNGGCCWKYRWNIELCLWLVFWLPSLIPGTYSQFLGWTTGHGVGFPPKLPGYGQFAHEHGQKMLPTFRCAEHPGCGAWHLTSFDAVTRAVTSKIASWHSWQIHMGFSIVVGIPKSWLV